MPLSHDKACILQALFLVLPFIIAAAKRSEADKSGRLL